MSLLSSLGRLFILIASSSDWINDSPLLCPRPVSCNGLKVADLEEQPGDKGGQCAMEDVAADPALNLGDAMFVSERFSTVFLK